MPLIYINDGTIPKRREPNEIRKRSVPCKCIVQDKVHWVSRFPFGLTGNLENSPKVLTIEIVNDLCSENLIKAVQPSSLYALYRPTKRSYIYI